MKPISCLGMILLFLVSMASMIFVIRLTDNPFLQVIIMLVFLVIVSFLMVFLFANSDNKGKSPPVNELPLATPVDDDGNDINLEEYRPASQENLRTPQDEDAQLAELTARLEKLKEEQEQKS